MSGLDIVGGVMHLAGASLRAWAAASMRAAMDPVGARRRKLAAVERDLQRHATALEWHHVGESLIEPLRREPNEIVVLGIDSAREPRVDLFEIARGSPEHVEIPVERVIDLARWHGSPSYFVLVHNHPCTDENEAPFPSPGDHRAAIELRAMLNEHGIHLDEVVVSRNSAHLVRASKLAARAARRNRR